VPETAGSVGRGRGFGPRRGIGVRRVTKTPRSPRRREGDVTNSTLPPRFPAPARARSTLVPHSGTKVDRTRPRRSAFVFRPPMWSKRRTRPAACVDTRAEHRASCPDDHGRPEIVTGLVPIGARSSFVRDTGPRTNALGRVCRDTHGTHDSVPSSAQDVTNLPRTSRVPGDSWRPQPARAATNRPGPQLGRARPSRSTPARHPQPPRPPTPHPPPTPTAAPLPPPPLRLR
jgi:hypothetical protein